MCPEEAGLPQDGGCPPPTEEETTGLVFGGIEWHDGRVLVEFQALSFQVGHDYDGVYCYPRLGIAPVEHYSFEPAGGQPWDITNPLGSRRLPAWPDRPLAVHVECGGDVVFSGIGGDPDSGASGGVYWGLGKIGGMLFSLDPDLAILEGNRDNNTYEKPVTMRVEFLDV